MCEIVDSPIGKLGLNICYDMRFVEMWSNLRRIGADVLLFPSAFTFDTGSAHWETLLCSISIQTQSYTIAAAQTGKHN